MARDFSVCNVITYGIYKLELWLQRIYREEIVDLKVAATYEVSKDAGNTGSLLTCRWWFGPWLRPCCTKGAVQVANHLYHIICEFGAPIILHSDNGLEFRNQVVNALLFIWPSLQLVHGRSRTAITQGSVKRSNGDFQGMLGSWIRENKCSKW